MSAIAETRICAPAPSYPEIADGGSDRRADIDKKPSGIAALLQEAGCEGLLVQEPENFSWLTSGASARGTLNPADLPALYFSLEGRWIIASNVDSQRIFDEEADGLGFQLKEWPWHWGRDQLLADLCHNRTVACDRAFGDCKVVNNQLHKLRRVTT